MSRAHRTCAVHRIRLSTSPMVVRLVVLVRSVHAVGIFAPAIAERDTSVHNQGTTTS